MRQAGYTLIELIITIIIICITVMFFVIPAILIIKCDDIAEEAGELAGEVQNGYESAREEQPTPKTEP